jgi:protein involved in polysaccharide export with SLBB domain
MSWKVSMLESKTFRVWLGVTLLLCAISNGEALGAQEKQRSIAPADYRIEIGDVLQIDVWRQSEITRTVPVQPDGSINLPLIGEVKVSGLSAMDLAGLLRAKLKDIIPNPQVTVIVSLHGTKLLAAPAARPLLKPPPPVSPELKQRCCVA